VEPWEIAVKRQLIKEGKGKIPSASALARSSSCGKDRKRRENRQAVGREIVGKGEKTFVF